MNRHLTLSGLPWNSKLENFENCVKLHNYNGCLREAKRNIPTRSVSEGQFRRSLTYVSGYDWYTYRVMIRIRVRILLVVSHRRSI